MAEELAGWLASWLAVYENGVHRRSTRSASRLFCPMKNPQTRHLRVCSVGFMPIYSNYSNVHTDSDVLCSGFVDGPGLPKVHKYIHYMYTR